MQVQIRPRAPSSTKLRFLPGLPGPRGPTGAAGAGAPPGVVNLADYVAPGPVDATQFAAALTAADGKMLHVQPGTYVFSQQITTTVSCYLYCPGQATFQLAAGAIVNTDASKTNYKSILQVRGCSWFKVEGIVFDGNRTAQTYPATQNTFGRGSRPWRHNGILEFTPGNDNLTRARNISIVRCAFINAYLSGLSTWQAENVTVDRCRFENNTWSGAVGCGLNGYTFTRNYGYRNGVSSIYTTARQDGDRATLQIREKDDTHTAASELIPTIPSTSQMFSYGVNVLHNRMIEDCVMGVFVRGTFGCIMAHNYVESPGYERLVSASYYAAGLWFEWGTCTIRDNELYFPYQNPLWKGREGIVCYTFEGNGAEIEMQGMYHAKVASNRIYCGQPYPGTVDYQANADKRNNIFRGIRVNANTSVEDNYIEGIAAGGLAISIGNDGVHNADNVSRVKVQGGLIRNFLSDVAIGISRYAGGIAPTGSLDLIDIRGVTILDGRSTTTGAVRWMIAWDVTMDPVVSETVIISDCTFDGSNSADSTLKYSGVRVRGTAGTKAIVLSGNSMKNVLTGYRITGGDQISIEGGAIHGASSMVQLAPNSNLGAVSIKGLNGYALTFAGIELILGAFTVAQLTATGLTVQGSGTLFTNWPNAGVLSYRADGNHLSLSGSQEFARIFTGAPNASAHHIGQFAKRTDTNAYYIAKSVGAGAADWSLLA